jgi:hypothetical protein
VGSTVDPDATTIPFFYVHANTSRFEGNVSVGGTFASYGGFSVSDISLKKDVKEMTSVTEKILALRPVTYNWKDPAKKVKEYGFIAQEVEKIYPELISHTGAPLKLSTIPLALSLKPGVNKFVKNKPSVTPLKQVKKNIEQEKFKTMSYVGLISPLVATVQEMYKKISANTREIASLEVQHEKDIILAEKTLEDMLVRVKKLEIENAKLKGNLK